jgi:hypothetical protein
MKLTVLSIVNGLNVTHISILKANINPKCNLKTNSGFRKHFYCWNAYYRPDDITAAEQLMMSPALQCLMQQ